ncbi:hypothetical protein VX159_00075 [Dechloromonas sp. ZY10]|uniref:hypothetical protein n=1 Tax=Dechloromonas aquae TaxID=2664436 RepID=UPI003529973C
MFRFFLRLVAVIQIVLGLAYAFAPAAFLARMGHSPLPPDLAYPFAMLAARFLVYGAGLWLISRDPARHLLWIRLMGYIQLIDLSAGLFHTLTGNVSWSHSAFPMFNAVWIALFCLLWKPQDADQAA